MLQWVGTDLCLEKLQRINDEGEEWGKRVMAAEAVLLGVWV